MSKTQTEIESTVTAKANEWNSEGAYTLSSPLPDTIELPMIFEEEFRPILPNPPFPPGFWQQDGLTLQGVANYIFSNQL